MNESLGVSIHPNAAKALNKRAVRILDSLAPVPLPARPVAVFRPDVHVSAHLTEKDLDGPILVGQVDYRGKEVTKYFQHGGRTIVVQGEGFQQLASLAEEVHQSETNRNYVSVQCLIECGFRWLTRRYRGETSEAFTEFVLREAGALVREVEIWFPLHRVYLESEIKVGKITFKTVTKEMLDRQIGQLPNDLPPEQRAAVEASFNRTRSKLQGCAAATIRLLAEPIRAEEIASEEAECSIAALRFFHPANGTPYTRAYCTKSGRENVATTCTLTVKDGMIELLRESSDSKTSLMWVVSDIDIRQFRQAGLDTLSQLLAKEGRSPFEKDLLDAFLIYSRNSLFDDPASRLIHILAATESILVRDKNEPIQKNLAERLAFLVGLTVEERMAIRDRVPNIYGLRSGFLHHGRSFTAMDALEPFMRDIWMAFVVLIRNIDKFRNKQELIDHLERRKME